MDLRRAVRERTGEGLGYSENASGRACTGDGEAKESRSFLLIGATCPPVINMIV